MWSMSQIGVGGENLKSGFFNEIWYELDLGPRDLVQDHSTYFNQRHSVVEIWARLGQVERKCTSDKFCQTDRWTQKWMEGWTDWSL